MALVIRSPRDEELRDVLVAIEAAFGAALEESWLERARKTMPLDRILVAFDDGAPAGAAAAFPLRLSIPGGELSCGGVTWVGVLPTHRRRGLARSLMRRQLDDLHERGEPLAALWASEASIYGRFGYGIAAPVHGLDADSSALSFRDAPPPQGTLRLVERTEAIELFPPVYARVRAGRAGMLARSPLWWSEMRCADWPAPPGLSPRFHVVLEQDGSVEGYVVYRVRERFEQGLAAGEVVPIELLGTSVEAVRELWRYVASIDLTTKVAADIVDPAAPLFLGVTDPRRLRLRVSDGLWLRLVDVDAALRARSWRGEDAVVVEVRDAFCPWNEGRYRIGADAGRTDAVADLALEVADLASLYLGGIDPAALHAAGRIEERTPGAVERAAALARTPSPPFCPEVF